jgi:hypothetical protein
LANVRKIIPPPSADPSPGSSPETDTVIHLVFAQKEWPIEIKYVEKGIVIEYVDRCT